MGPAWLRRGVNGYDFGNFSLTNAPGPGNAALLPRSVGGPAPCPPSHGLPGGRGSAGDAVSKGKHSHLHGADGHGPGPQVSTEDFEALLAGSTMGSPSFFHPGQEVEGVVVRVETETVYLDLGGKSEGLLSLPDMKRAEPDDEGTSGKTERYVPRIGDRLSAYVVSTQGGLIRLATHIGRTHDNLDMLIDAYEAEIPVQGRVAAINKGGYEIDLGGARGFCPHSQMDLRFVDHPESFLGRDLEFRISEVREEGRNIIVSRRVLLEDEAARQREETLQLLREGTDLTGRVSSIRSFGAFVDLGGIDGLIHVSEISHQRVEDPAEVLRPGQEVRVRVLSVEQGGRRISLSMKVLEADPWESVEERFPQGARVRGRVVRLAPFGAFVNLAPGVDGLLHISALSPGRRVAHPKEVLAEGQEIDVMVGSVDPIRERIGLELSDPRTPGSDHEDEAAAALPEVGAIIPGAVEKVTRFGVFVRIGPGRTGLIPRSELDLPSGADLRPSFPVGRRIDVKLIEIDEERGRYTLSLKALHREREQNILQSYQRSTADEPGGASGLGTLGDLLRAKLDQRTRG